MIKYNNYFNKNNQKIKNRPETTLFLLTSVDGKISTGSSDNRDADKDYPNIPGVASGLQQYYDIEQTTSIWSLNSGRVMAKIGMNTMPTPEKIPVNFIVIDNNSLNRKGLENMMAKANNLVIITTNKNHIARDTLKNNFELIYIQSLNKLGSVFSYLKTEYDCREITIQTGGTLNQIMLKLGLIDNIQFVVAPILVGGKDVSTSFDGDDQTMEELKNATLTLKSVEQLKNNYLQIKYKVNNN